MFCGLVSRMRMILVPPDEASVCAVADCGGCCMTLWVPFLLDFLHRQLIHTHMHRMISSRRIPPPTPPPISAATEREKEVVIEVGYVEVEIEAGYVEVEIEVGSMERSSFYNITVILNCFI